MMMQIAFQVERGLRRARARARAMARQWARAAQIVASHPQPRLRRASTRRPRRFFLMSTWKPWS